jgi:hypothetical protein
MIPNLPVLPLPGGYQMKAWFWVIVASLALLTGCGGFNGNYQAGLYPPPSRADHGQFAAGGSKINFDVPIQLNKQVEAYLDYFSTKRKGVIQRQLNRSTRYLPMIKRIFREYGLPDDLAYLAMIESGFNPRACSPAGAKGMWQFIKGTGRRYGLIINRHVDQRFDPEKSTRAAARYLRDLYEQFGSWYLAAASYNCGERRVERELRKSSYRNFWQLSANHCLPNETKNYVPQMIAATIIAKNPSRYGFNYPPGFHPPTMLASNNANNGIGPTEARNFSRASMIPTPSSTNRHSYSLFGGKSTGQAYVARKPKTQERQITGPGANPATYAKAKPRSGPYVASMFGYYNSAPPKGRFNKPGTECHLARRPKKNNYRLTMTHKSKKPRHRSLARRSRPRHPRVRVARHRGSHRKYNHKIARTKSETYLASRVW